MKMTSLACLAEELCIDEKLLLILLDITTTDDNKTVNELIHIDDIIARKVATLADDLTRYANVSEFLEENSKAFGDQAEKSLVTTLGLSKPKDAHHDGYDSINDNKIEIKVSRMMEPKHNMPFSTFAKRALHFDPTNPCKGSTMYQHVKPAKFDYMIGALLYMDAVVFHMIESNKINGTTDLKKQDPTKIRLREQQADQKTEGYVSPHELPIVGIIQGEPFNKIIIPFKQLYDAYETGIPFCNESIGNIKC
jgi:hypothetical protein